MASATQLTAEQRKIRGRIGALALHASGGTNTGPATAAMLSRFEREVLAAAAARGETLTPEVLAARTRSARRAHFTKLALASSRARSKRMAGPADNGPALEDRRDRGDRPTAL